MFRRALRIVIKIIREVESTISWQFVECIDFSFTRLQRGAHVLLRIIIHFHTARLQPRDSQLVKLLAAELTRVFAV